MSSGAEDPSLPQFSWDAWFGLDESSAREALQAQAGTTDAQAGPARQPVQPDVSWRGRKTPSWGAKQSRHKGYFRHPGLLRVPLAADRERHAQSRSKPTPRSDGGASHHPTSRDAAAATLARMAAGAEQAAHTRSATLSGRGDGAPSDEEEARTYAALGLERTPIDRLNRGAGSQSGRGRPSSHTGKGQPRNRTALLSDIARGAQLGIRGGMESSQGGRGTRPSKRRPQPPAVPLPDGQHGGTPRTRGSILPCRSARGGHLGRDRQHPPTTLPDTEHGTRGVKDPALVVKRPRPNRPADDDALLDTTTTPERMQNVHTEGRAELFDDGRGVTRTHAAAALERHKHATVPPQTAARAVPASQPALPSLNMPAGPSQSGAAAARVLPASQPAPPSLNMLAGPSRPGEAASALLASQQAAPSLSMPVGQSRPGTAAPTRRSGPHGPSNSSVPAGPSQSGKGAVLQAGSLIDPVQTGAEAATYRVGDFDVKDRRRGPIPQEWIAGTLLASRKEGIKSLVLTEIEKSLERLQKLRKDFVKTSKLSTQSPTHQFEAYSSVLHKVEGDIREEQERVKNWERILEMVENDEITL